MRKHRSRGGLSVTSRNRQYPRKSICHQSEEFRPRNQTFSRPLRGCKLRIVMIDGARIDDRFFENLFAFADMHGNTATNESFGKIAAYSIASPYRNSPVVQQKRKRAHAYSADTDKVAALRNYIFGNHTSSYAVSKIYATHLRSKKKRNTFRCFPFVRLN